MLGHSGGTAETRPTRSREFSDRRVAVRDNLYSPDEVFNTALLCLENLAPGITEPGPQSADKEPGWPVIKEQLGLAPRAYMYINQQLTRLFTHKYL